MHHTIRHAAIVLAFAASAASAAPTLLGDSVELSASNSNYNASTASATVASSGGPEFIIRRGTGTDPRWSVDVDALSVTFALLTGTLGPLDAVFTLGDLDFGAGWSGISAITVNVAGTIDGFDPSQVSFTADTLSLQVQRGQTWSVGSAVTVDFLVHAAVPEPASAVLAALALAALAVSRRPRRPRQG